MSKSSEHARLLLEKADEDLYVLQRLSRDEGAPISVIGFHAQQAVEKCLKAVLAGRAVAYPRTHDVEGLVELIQDNGIAMPPEADRLHHLTPFAAELRYGSMPAENETAPALDRAWALRCACEVRSWADAIVETGRQ
jgi:HEPN domain-containing protein